jgi:alpha-amylase/alpha-mannosidase (GH57 family)
MSAEVRVELILLWHQHQPDYRDPRTGRARLPWVRLHGTKDYLDMARRLEPFPRVKATFNFVPCLVDQIEAAIAGAPDDLFDLLARDPATLSHDERLEVARRCVQIPSHARGRIAALLAAAERGAELGPAALLALEMEFLLGWLDPMFHGAPEVLRASESPTLEARDALLALHARLLGEIVPAHRSLREQGRIEISTSPYYHPILPLLIDVTSAARARPDLPLPRIPFAGPEDARRQVERAVARHTRAFGESPRGMWPSEGSVSPEVAELAASLGLTWMASDQGVLERSLEGGVAGAHHRPWRFETRSGPIHLFFRDHELSDRIGFVYQRWRAGDAVADLLERVRRIGREAGEEIPVVSVMLDGENCWEGYERDGGPFLDRLYSELEAAEDIRTTTPFELLARRSGWPRLERLHSGSWIDADFHIWAGHPEKNRAWDLLARARGRLVAHAGAPEAAWEELMRAEGSDWFWWLGEDHFTSDKGLFDALFRGHLRAIHEACGEPVPIDLDVPIAAPVKPDLSQLPAAFFTPVIDGRQTQYYEWQPAGRRRIAGAGSAMHHAGAGLVRDLQYGFDRDSFFLRVDFESVPAPARGLRIEWLEPLVARHEIERLTPGVHWIERVGESGARTRLEGAQACLGEVLELSLPLETLGLRPRDRMAFRVQVLDEGRPVETAPEGDPIRLQAPDESFDVAPWIP